MSADAEFVETHAVYVKRIAAQVRAQLGFACDMDDLIAEATTHRMMLQFGKSATDKVKLATVMQFTGIAHISRKGRAI